MSEESRPYGTLPQDVVGRGASGVLLAAAVGYVALAVFGLAAVGEFPKATDTGEQVVAFFRTHGNGVRWSVWAGTVAAPLFAVVVALLRRVLPAPHRDIFLIGGIAIIAETAVQSWTSAGLALHADQLQPATARTVLDVALFYGPVLTGAFITLIAPVTVLALRGRAGLPFWLGVLGAVAVVEQAVETVTIFGTSGFTEPGGAMNLQLGAGLVLTWTLAFAGWAALRRGDLPH